MADPVVTPPAAPSPGTPDPAAPVAPAAPAAPAPAAPATPPAAPASTVLTEPAPAAPAPAPAAAEPISVTFPKGMEVDAGVLTKFNGIAKEAGLKGPQAQQMADLYVEMQQNAATRHLDMITGWAEEARQDKEIGGDNWPATLTAAKKVLNAVGSQELKALLTSTGLGNHKAVIGALARLGKLISDDRLPGGGTGAAPPADDREAALRAAYPNSPSMFQPKKG